MCMSCGEEEEAACQLNRSDIVSEEGEVESVWMCVECDSSWQQTTMDLERYFELGENE